VDAERRKKENATQAFYSAKDLLIQLSELEDPKEVSFLFNSSKWWILEDCTISVAHGGGKGGDWVEGGEGRV